jgi:predicted RNA-binding protein
MATEQRYWLNLFSSETWNEFLAAGGRITGFRQRRWSVVQRLKQGDYLLCYLTGLSRWVGLLEVTDPPFFDETPIWTADRFPARVKVQPIIELTPETAVPIFDLREKLSIFRNLTNPNAWTGHLRSSPAQWKAADGEVVVAALKAARDNPVLRQLDRTKLRRVSPYLQGVIPPPGTPAVANAPVLDPADDVALAAEESNGDSSAPRRSSAHTRVQWLLLNLGADMGLDVWVAKGDAGRDWDGRPFAAVKNLRKRLPRQFDRYTSRTIEEIDVLWIKNDAIIMAFEIESTTTVYSGLLRLSDLLARQPHLNIPLFIVAPVARRNKVVREINRPTFAALQTPLRDVCQLITFEDLEDFDARVRSALPSLAVLNPDALPQIASSAAAEDEDLMEELG